MTLATSRRTSCTSCAVIVLSGLAAYRGLSTAFSLLPGSASSSSNGGEVARSRREFLAGAAVLTATGSAPAAQAAEFLGLGKPKGPFEIDPKDVLIVGNAEDPKIVTAREQVKALLDEATEALTKLEADPQLDLSYMVKAFGLSDVREATNAINNIMDPPSAAGVQRLQRLMIQAKFVLEDDIPFPTNKKGVQQPRGEKRLERIKSCLKDYIQKSKDLLEFF